MEREVHQARLLLLEIGVYLNMEIPTRNSDQRQWEISREEAIRDEKWFNETLDKIEELSKEMYFKLDDLINERSAVSDEKLRDLQDKAAYIHNLVRKVETVGECTGTRIRGPKI